MFSLGDPLLETPSDIVRPESGEGRVGFPDLPDGRSGC